jgi:hypothetical protein
LPPYAWSVPSDWLPMNVRLKSDIVNVVTWFAMPALTV